MKRCACNTQGLFHHCDACSDCTSFAASTDLAASILWLLEGRDSAPRHQVSISLWRTRWAILLRDSPAEDLCQQHVFIGKNGRSLGDSQPHSFALNSTEGRHHEINQNASAADRLCCPNRLPLPTLCRKAQQPNRSHRRSQRKLGWFCVKST